MSDVELTIQNRNERGHLSGGWRYATREEILKAIVIDYEAAGEAFSEEHTKWGDLGPTTRRLAAQRVVDAALGIVEVGG